MSQQGAEDVSALIARKRAEVLSRLASLNLPTAGAASQQPPALPGRPPAVLGGPPAAPGRPPAALGGLPGGVSVQDAIAAARARVEARLKSQSISADAPGQTAKTHTNELHPMLRDDYKDAGNRRKRQRVSGMPLISSVKANQPKAPAQLKLEHEVPAAFTDPEQNPYFDPTLGNRRTAGPQTRKHNKQFQFVRPGRFVEQAEKQRAEAKMEQLKEEIRERSEKAKLEEEVLDATAIRPPEPPAVEWWDAPFVASDGYDLERALVTGPESLVTLYVQHPVPIDPPAPIRAAGSAPTQLILTQKERKKIRRQRRLEQQRERREKVMLGLLPPEPPKVKLSNFMRVMANQSVPDPTRLEAEVRKQAQARVAKHEADNAARKLTKEQRHDKLLEKTAADEKKSLVSAAFRIGRLSHPQHRYKVAVNARQMHLTGAALACPQMGLIVVEGSAQNVRAYKKLMLRRIDWTASQLEPDGSGGGADVDYTSNECHLIWQGDIAARRFTQFRQHTCPIESQAKRWLAGAGCEALWQLAKQFQPDDGRPTLDPLV